jgi:hypothetical protein
MPGVCAAAWGQAPLPGYTIRSRIANDRFEELFDAALARLSRKPGVPLDAS